jgi:hypothetical protein
MALAKLLPKHGAYLERTARRLSNRKGIKITAQEVLHALLDLAIQDEGVYDPEDPGRPLDPLRRRFLQADTSGRTTRLVVASEDQAGSEAPYTESEKG